MSSRQAQLVHPTTGPATGTRWDDEGAEIRSLVGNRVFKLQVDAQGIVHTVCRNRDNVHEVLLADVIADARDSAAVLRTQAQHDACAVVAAFARHTFQRLVAALASHAVPSPSLRPSGHRRLQQGL